jgi:hypothetical protein
MAEEHISTKGISSEKAEQIVGGLISGDLTPAAPEREIGDGILKKLRERETPLLASGSPAHGPG